MSQLSGLTFRRSLKSKTNAGGGWETKERTRGVSVLGRGRKREAGEVREAQPRKQEQIHHIKGPESTVEKVEDGREEGGRLGLQLEAGTLEQRCCLGGRENYGEDGSGLPSFLPPALCLADLGRCLAVLPIRKERGGSGGLLPRPPDACQLRWSLFFHPCSQEAPTLQPAQAHLGFISPHVRNICCQERPADTASLS